jgi:pimeloyl-ACP methyl ester carboxylesterase
MSVESEEFTELGDEFALVAQTAEEAGATGRALPRVRRGWVNVPAGGHVSRVFWGDAQPEIVFLHDLGESARAWDAVAVTIGRASVAIDLPGHGRSDGTTPAPGTRRTTRSSATRAIPTTGWTC